MEKMKNNFYTPIDNYLNFFHYENQIHIYIFIALDGIQKFAPPTFYLLGGAPGDQFFFAILKWSQPDIKY